ncbi:MAG: trypsin-like peptidase domain-containing protein [Chlorobi bacterium]|nr:trypsin-like peptidase domain-containing protein [Chlorobiota bacterium]
MTKKQIWLVAGLMILSAGIGALFMTGTGNLPFGFAGPDDVKLGADAPPITASNEVQALNDAYVAVSKAVTPQVVYITVTREVRPTSRKRDFNFDDPFGFFQFPNRSIPRQGSGSGVIVSPDGYILTNNHVVQDASEDGILVEFYDGRQHTAKLIGNDPTTDLAVIKVDGDGLPTAAIGTSENAQVGQIVFAVGNPLGLTSTVTQGIISAIGRGQLNLNRDSEGYGIEDFIQTDAAINPGNSGGGLFNLSGELIGINSAIATNTGYSQGYGFAIPIDLAVAVAKDLIEDGEVNRGYIGVMIKAVDQKLAKFHNLSPGQGVLIDGVQENSAAEVSKLKQGDIILEVDGQTVGSANQLQGLIARKRIGDKVILKIFRYGETFDKTLTLKARPNSGRVASLSESDRESGTRDNRSTMNLSSLGMEVSELTSRDKRALDLQNGVIVRGVEVYGEAFNQGVREGDVVLSVNRNDVNSPEEVADIIDGVDSGEVVLLEIQRTNGMKSLVALEVKK